MSRQDRVFAGVAGLIGVVVAAQFVPELVGAVLVTFSLVVFVLAVVGLVWPSAIRIPNRLASVWVFMFSVGLLAGGAVLLSPPNGETTASDAETAIDSPMADYEARERTALERRIARAERLAAERLAAEPEARTTRRSAALQRFRDADGRNMCNIRLQDAARMLFGAGHLYRWTERSLEARFPRQRETGAVTTYVGDAIQFQDDDGSWLNAVYECVYDHDAGEIVDVRTREGRLQ